MHGISVHDATIAEINLKHFFSGSFIVRQLRFNLLEVTVPQSGVLSPANAGN
jgi:hypothetical protein